MGSGPSSKSGGGIPSSQRTGGVGDLGQARARGNADPGEWLGNQLSPSHKLLEKGLVFVQQILPLGALGLTLSYYCSLFTLIILGKLSTPLHCLSKGKPFRILSPSGILFFPPNHSCTHSLIHLNLGWKLVVPQSIYFCKRLQWWSLPFYSQMTLSPSPPPCFSPTVEERETPTFNCQLFSKHEINVPQDSGVMWPFCFQMCFSTCNRLFVMSPGVDWGKLGRGVGCQGGKWIWRLFIPFSTQENSKHFIFIYQKIIPWKKIHNTDTEKSEHVMSNYFKKHISKPKANLFFF